MKKTSLTSRVGTSRSFFGGAALAMIMLFATSAGADEWYALEEAGFGDRENYAVFSLGAFDESLYAGTGVRRDSEATADIWKMPRGGTAWRNVTPRWALEVKRVRAMARFGDHLYVGTESPTGAEVWRTAGEITIRIYSETLPGFPRVPIRFQWEMWEDVTPSEWTSATAWAAVTSMAVFEGSLYLAKGSPLEIWKTPDGTVWEPVVLDSFADPTTNDTGKLMVYRDYIYAITSVALVGGGGGCEVWRSGDGWVWEALVATGEPSAILDDGFGDADVGGCISAAVFDDTLYVGTVNHGEAGPQIFRFDGDDWLDVTPPLVPWGFTKGVQTLGVYGGRLYGGDRLVFPGFGGPRIYATSTAEPDDWAIVNEETDMGLAIEAMLAAYGYFYVGTTGIALSPSDPDAGGRVYQKRSYPIEWLRFFGLEPVVPRERLLPLR